MKPASLAAATGQHYDLVVLDDRLPGLTVLDLVMRRLRLRLELEPAKPKHLVTVRRLGYALQP